MFCIYILCTLTHPSPGPGRLVYFLVYDFYSSNNLTDGERPNHLVPRSRELRQDTTIGEDLAHCFKGV